MIKLNIGDTSKNGQVTIVDEDRLCYLVKSNSRGAMGLRTISKALLQEFVTFIEQNPEVPTNEVRFKISGQSEIDKYEYGYGATIGTMAKMILGQEGIVKGVVKGLQNEVQPPLQQIFYGAPGTGKSHRIKNNDNVKKADEKNLVFRTTFHPDSDYSTFVGCYKPTMKPVLDKYKAVAGKDEEITYSFVSQAFLQAYVAAWNNPEEKVFLVVEEINRGNCAQIFGDLFQLLDRNEEGYSDYPIMADRDLTKYLNGKDENGQDVLTNKDGIKDGKLRLPSNLYIWATMNTSDQSLFPIDSAFKRRWDWKYIPIDTTKESWNINADGVNYDWSDFLEKINAKIETVTSSEDKMLGFYFCKAEDNTITAEKFVNKVVFYLWNDVFKDYGFDDSIFNDDNNVKLTFRNFYTADGKVDESKVKRFLDNLEVKNDKTPEPEAQE